MTPAHLSFWLTLLGFKPGRAGAWAWVMCGFGWLGVSWERLCHANFLGLKSGQRGPLPTWYGFYTHMPQLILGIWRLGRHQGIKEERRKWRKGIREITRR